MRLFSLLAAVGLTSSAFSQTIYVDANLLSGANDGSSWADAHRGSLGLQAALAAVTPGEQIFVADGTYIPNGTLSRTTSFRLLNDVEIYGGFAGGESSPDERPAFGTSPSILSGDLMGNDVPGTTTGIAENAFHVVRTTSTNETAVLDGFVIRGGNSNGGGSNNDRGGGILCINSVEPTIRNCDFVDNRCTFGGGAGYINASGPSFTNCRFIDNVGGAFGGAFDIAGGNGVIYDRCWFEGNTGSRAGALEIFSSNNISVLNSVFIDNVATGGSGGGGLWIGSGGATEVIGCTIVGNRSTSQTQGGLREQGANVTVRNTILWDNEGPGGAQGPNNQINIGVGVQYSLVEGGYAGTGNLSADPNFTDLAGRDLRLALPSPAVDAGINASATAVDYLGARRRVDEPGTADTGSGTAPIVDMGAYEVSSNIGTVECSANPNSTGTAGRIDATGSLVAMDNNVTLVASGLPMNAFGFFLASRTSGFVANPGGSSGNLCLGGAIGRYVGPGQIQNTAMGSSFSLALDLNAVPQPTGLISAQAGESWAFQAWHRDAVIGFPTSNFTDVVRLTFE